MHVVACVWWRVVACAWRVFDPVPRVFVCVTCCTHHVRMLGHVSVCVHFLVLCTACPWHICCLCRVCMCFTIHMSHTAHIHCMCVVYLCVCVCFVFHTRRERGMCVYVLSAPSYFLLCDVCKPHTRGHVDTTCACRACPVSSSFYV